MEGEQALIERLVVDLKLKIAEGDEGFTFATYRALIDGLRKPDASQVLIDRSRSFADGRLEEDLFVGYLATLFATAPKKADRPADGILQPADAATRQWNELNERLTSTKGNAFTEQLEAMRKPDYARGDSLIQRFSGKVDILTPLISTTLFAAIVQNRVLEPLAYRDPSTFDWKPLLATDWTMSADGLTVDAQLRHDIQFSDGAPMTAEDVVFGIDFQRDPDVDAPRSRACYEPLDHVEKVNDFEVKFVFKRPYFDALSIALGSVPLHKKFYSRYTPAEFNQQVGLLIGTGPYRLADPTSWRPGMPIDLVRNERYWGPAPTFDKIGWREVEEPAAALSMFQNGEIDVCPVTAEQFAALKDDPTVKAKANLYSFYPRNGGYSYIAWNEKRNAGATLFSDKRVRQAMTMLIDRNRIARDVFHGCAKPALGPFALASKQNDPLIQPWPYDVKRATALLAEVGFKSKNAAGVLTDADGHELRFKLTYPDRSVASETAKIVKENLAKIGIVVEPDPCEWHVFMNKLTSRDFDAVNLGWSGSAETDIYQMFHSSQIADGGDNFMSYVNPEFDKAIDDARKTVSEPDRMPLWQRAHRILNEDQPYTFLVVAQSQLLVDKRVTNVSSTRSGLNYVADDPMPIPWYVPVAQQRHRD